MFDVEILNNCQLKRGKITLQDVLFWPLRNLLN